jgi:hypothetical protein
MCGWVICVVGLRGVLSVCCGDVRAELRDVWLPFVPRWVVCGFGRGRRVRGMLRWDLPAKHGLRELHELPLWDLPEHDRRGLVDSLRELRGRPVRYVGRIDSLFLVQWRVVLGGRSRAVLEVRCGHFPACFGVSLMCKLRRGDVLLLCRVI